MIKTNIQWLPEIPDDWKIGRFKNVARYSKTVAGEKSSEYQRLALTLNGVIKRDKDDNNGLQPKEFDGYQIVNSGDYVFKMIDLQNVQTSRVGLTPWTGLVSPAYLRFTPTSGASKFYYYYLMSLYYRQVFNHLSDTGVRSSISGNEMGNLAIPIPPLDEQKRIADFLDDRIGKIDALIENEDKQIEDLESYKKAIISSAVTKGLHSDAVVDSVESRWISQIPHGWSLRRTKYIATSIEKGSGITRDDVNADGDIKCVRYGEIYFQYDREITKCVSSTFLAKISSPRFISKGDILCAGTGELVEEIGKNVVYMCDEKCLAGGDIIIIHHHENPVYLNYALNSSFSQNQKSYGKAKLKVVHISADEIGNVILPLPPIEAQKEIASYLDQKCEAMDTIAKDKRQKIDELKSLKASLIYELVTGKRRLTS